LRTASGSRVGAYGKVSALGRYHYKVVRVRAESLRPLEPPDAYAGLPRRVRGVAEQIRDVRWPEVTCAGDAARRPGAGANAAAASVNQRVLTAIGHDPV
jgi:hypothetical protein